MINEKEQARKGFTLLEVMLAIGIFLLLLVGVGYLLSDAFKIQQVTFSQLTAQKEGRRVVEDFVKEMRRADSSSIGSYPLEQATASAITFYSDIDSDTYRERVRYFLDGQLFRKGVIKATGTPLGYNPANEVVATVVQDVIPDQIFSYYDQSYEGASSSLAFPINVTQVRLVKINLTIEQNPQLAPGPLTVTSQVEMRNLKD